MNKKLLSKDKLKINSNFNKIEMVKLSKYWLMRLNVFDKNHLRANSNYFEAHFLVIVLDQ